jgi:hypothetical protein
MSFSRLPVLQVPPACYTRRLRAVFKSTSIFPNFPSHCTVSFVKVLPESEPVSPFTVLRETWGGVGIEAVRVALAEVGASCRTALVLTEANADRGLV